MIKLPDSLQAKLNQVVPKKEQLVFVTKVIESALNKIKPVSSKGSSYVVYTDGGARGNPGPAGCGGVIFDNQKKELARFNHFISHATNNEAEYTALLLAAQKVVKLNPYKVIFYLDSELIVKQMQGLYKVKKAELLTINQKITKIISSIPQVEFVHIPRAKNHLADSLVNQAIDQGIRSSSF